MHLRPLSAALLLVLAVAPAPAVQDDGASATFRGTLARARAALDQGRLDVAAELAVRALERDRRSAEAWGLRAEVAAALDDRDLRVYSRHRELRLLEAQGAERGLLRDKRASLEELDPIARDLYGLRDRFTDELVKLAQGYEKDGRPHGAIRTWKQVLALDPEHPDAQLEIERIASAPDPSLAGDAKPKDLFADVTDEWIAEFDAAHSDWEEAAREERTNYWTVTNAGYEVLIRTAEAMEQMAAFYKRFFRYGTPEDGKSVPRITVHVFKSRDEYLELGIGPPVEWSAGHFTGSHVECYIGNGGFEGMVGTLFHEAAHQYVSLATNAVGWLNEGLASFFEGTRILPNGTVVMNMPADHRLFPLAERMEEGWMENPQDGYDPNDSSSMPSKAPTWRIVVENRYSWGPPWYAPTWGVVFFCYNFQDPVDGRFVYRDAFLDFVDASGGKVGETAVETFEEVVLANPLPPYPELEGLEEPEEGSERPGLPETVEELDAVWKEWILALRDERSGKAERAKPYKRWARYAVAAEDFDAAVEHFEKGIVATPEDVDLLVEYARLLSEEMDDEDRAAKLVLEALHLLESAPEPDETAIEVAEELLADLDPKRRNLTRVLERLDDSARSIVGRYRAAGLNAMVQDVAWRLGSDLDLPDLLVEYEDAVRARGGDLAVWELAYNERDLDGWSPGSEAFAADGVTLHAENGAYDPASFDFQTLTLDRITAGDFSLEAEILARRERCTFAGFVFGNKSSSTFHGALFQPAGAAKEGAAVTSWLDVMSSYGAGATKTWRHVPVDDGVREDDVSTAGNWNRLRLEVVGPHVDVFWNDELVTRHEFPSRDVLQGRFGLVVGRGEARFRNVRFLARDPRDPAGRVLRRMRAEEMAARGEPVGGSYQGLVPPFPTVRRWVQGERASWDEAGPVPQVLVLWSTQQNELVPIHEWLTWLAEEWSGVGLRIVSVASPNDAAQLEGYLAAHPFPDAVAVDLRPDGTAGIGDTFETFFVRRFNLPRLLLLDLDGTVYWEGDPGFAIGETYAPPYDSYMRAPLEELVEKRRLVALGAWRKKWERVGLPALVAGDVETALPLLREAESFDGRYAPTARVAAAKLQVLRAALADLEATADALERDDALPALAPLLEWAPLLEVELDRRSESRLARRLRGTATKDWNDALRAAKRAGTGRGTPAERVDALLADLDDLSGAVVQFLAAEVRAARVAGGDEAALAVVEGVERIPARWLARERFGW